MTFMSLPMAWEGCIDGIYDAVGDAHCLAQALGEFRRHFEAQGVMFLTVPDARYRATSHVGVVGVPDHALIEYHTHFNSYDEWAIAAARRDDFGLGAIYRGSQLISRQQMLQTYFGRSFVLRYGIFDILTSVVEISNSTGPTTFITFHRQEGQQPFGAADAMKLSQLLPHVQRALRLHRRLAPSLALGVSLEQIVQRLELPVIFLGAGGAILDCNAAAQTCLAKPLESLQTRFGKLAMAIDGEWQDLAPHIAALHPADCPTLSFALQAAGGQCAELNLRLINGAFNDYLAKHKAIAVATVHPQPVDLRSNLQRRYLLTLAEAEIAVRLADGQSVSQISQLMGKSLATVRCHLQRSFDKCGVHRQVQLAALIRKELDGSSGGPA